jgi:ribosomal protein S18 acetylase RimI-like enzyme
MMKATENIRRKSPNNKMRHIFKKNSDKFANININRTRPEEWPQIENEVLCLEKDIFKRDADTDEEDFIAFKNPRGINLVLLDKTRLVGYLMAEPLKDTDYHKGMKKYRSQTMYLESIGILKEYRHEGLGYQLMAAFILLSSLDKYRLILTDATSQGMVKLAGTFHFKKLRYNQDHRGGAWIMRRGNGQEKK